MAIVWGPNEKADICVDWAKGTDISVYRCLTCGLVTSDQALFIHHVVRAHRTGVILAPTNYDQVRRS